MTTALYIIGGIVALLIVATIISYNRFINQKNLIRNAWSNIDTELKRRYDLVPNLVETVKGYAAHERTVLEEVTQARAQAVAETGAPEEQATAEAPLVQALRHLFAVVESYPELKASAHFLELQRELANTEDRIQAARRFFNANVAEYNRRVRSVPSNLLAWIFEFTEEQYFQVEPAVRPQIEAAPSTF
jgi:LemA protein